MKQGRTFVGFGFGPIQAGLFLQEAYLSRQFDRLVVAEIKESTIASLRRAGGHYQVQVATRTGLVNREVAGVEALHPVADRAALLAAIGEASEICTALPSVEFFAPVAELLAEGLRTRCIIYAAENHNHAAELLEEAVRARRPDVPPCQFLNTVIGKMSGVSESGFLVEEFNRILISRITLPGFRRGIEVFEEKDDLLPFEEAKLFGHNAIHALLGFAAQARGLRFMSEAAQDAALMREARAAFLEESGAALCAKHGGRDPLFTPQGFESYADDLLERMVNPWLRDAVARVVRDPARKLGWNDRFIGAMRLALDESITPRRLARGAAMALAAVAAERPGVSRAKILDELWAGEADTAGRKQALEELILDEC